jgi:hypothetical protein
VSGYKIYFHSQRLHVGVRRKKEESYHAKANSAGLIPITWKLSVSKGMQNQAGTPDEIQLGSVRREIFIAFAQPGAANSLHPLYFSRG